MTQELPSSFILRNSVALSGSSTVPDDDRYVWISVVQVETWGMMMWYTIIQFGSVHEYHNNSQRGDINLLWLQSSAMVQLFKIILLVTSSLPSPYYYWRCITFTSSFLVSASYPRQEEVLMQHHSRDPATDTTHEASSISFEKEKAARGKLWLAGIRSMIRADFFPFFHIV